MQVQKKIVAVGNPGAGKSTFGNCLLGRVWFRSGVSTIGSGVTLAVEEHANDRYRYVDCPGLADTDEKIRSDAADQVTSALRENIDTRILFFIRTDGGRILPEDKLMMARVAQALGNNFQEDKYGVIFNKFPKSVHNKHAQGGDEEKHFLEQFWANMTVDINGKRKQLPRSKHITFFLKHKDLDEEDNVLVALPKKFITFVDNLTPVKIAKETVASVDMTNIDCDLKALSEDAVAEIVSPLYDPHHDVKPLYLAQAGSTAEVHKECNVRQKKQGNILCWNQGSNHNAEQDLEHTYLQKSLLWDSILGVMDKVNVYSSTARTFASDVRTRSVAAGKNPKVQATVGSAACGTVLLGLCGGVLGVVVGGTAGIAVGLPFVLFTFSLSVPFSAVIGGGVAGSAGLVVGGTAGCATGGTVGYTVFTWREEIIHYVNKVLAKVKDAKDSSRAHVLTVFATARARLLVMRMSIVAQSQNASAITKRKLSALTDSGVQVAKDPKAQATAAGATVGGVALGAAGGFIGLATGAVVGGVVGIVPALFTFGLSIPVCSVVGGGAGLCVGTVVGGTAGAAGGGAVGCGAYGKRLEIAECVRKCHTYTTAKLGEVQAFVKSKTTALNDTPAQRPAAEIAKKSVSVGA